MDQQTLGYYDANAQDVAMRYEAVPSPVAEYFPFAFPAGSRVLDIGVGSGRDLAHLVRAGYDAYGVEPSKALCDFARRHHPGLDKRIVCGGLPELAEPFGGAFDGVLCSAVLMHVPRALLFDAALGIRTALKHRGRLLLSLPSARGDVGENDRDAQGRLFSGYSPEEIQLLFERLGFELLARWDTDDALKRQGNTWYTLLFEYRDILGIRAVDQIEGILNRDRKEASYKLALFRALAEIAMQEERSVQWRPDGSVAVPINRIARRWLHYYWPLFASETFVPQSNAEGNGGKSLKFRSALQSVIKEYQGQGVSAGFTAWYLDDLSGRFSPSIQLKMNAAMTATVAAIRNGPVRYSGGALETGQIFAYDSAHRAVIVPAGVWKELTLMGHWIIDAVLLRWAALTARFGAKYGLTLEHALHLLMLKPDPERATTAARKAFINAGLNRCTWSGKRVNGKFAVDHAIPFSLWGTNDFWNLFQVDMRINSNKSDKLPTAELLHERRAYIIEDWRILRDAYPDAFDQQTKQFVGKAYGAFEQWEDVLFSAFRQSVEITALQRGIERWAPRT